MCRLAAFPPRFPRKKAINVLLEFENHNKDGTGVAYVKDGNFVVEKKPKAISTLLDEKEELLSHMPYDGWTIAHLRAASHGENTMQNTHPFVVGNWCICHNGIWSDHSVARLALSSYIKFEGETDSEVAAHLIKNLGPKRFSTAVSHGGVFLGLKLDGSLWVMKTSGQLTMQNLDSKQTLIASELDDEIYDKQGSAHEGWYHFNKDGMYVAHKRVLPTWERSGCVTGVMGTRKTMFVEDDDDDENSYGSSSRGVAIERMGGGYSGNSSWWRRYE